MLDLPCRNIAGYLSRNYGRDVLHLYDELKKSHERGQSFLLDLKFLKSCRSNNVIPKFLWFRTANPYLLNTRAYRQCQQRLLVEEIRLKYKDWNRWKKIYSYHLNQMKEILPEDLLKRVLDYISDRSIAVLCVKDSTLTKKLDALKQSMIVIEKVNRHVVKNFSTRKLSDEEIQCLAHGLDYGLVPKDIDDLSVLSNAENYFQRVTDVYAEQKKFLSGEQYENDAAKLGVRVLNGNELSLAYKLRSITDSFRTRAYRFSQTQNRINDQQKHFRSVLKGLKEETSLVITRPDKGRGVVVLNKVDYLLKMENILNDQTKFICLSTDRTIPLEIELRKLLNSLLANGHISNDFYNLACPYGSLPGRLYGLPKIHKRGVPLRPVLSAISTFNYGLGKALQQMLSMIIDKKNMIRDSFAFVKELSSLPISMSQYKMVSFDVTSLYTNIPLNETIDIIINYLYNGNIKPPSMREEDMRKLLIYAAKESHFLFDGKLYQQIDGVSMGSPLAPILAEIFLQDFERKHSSSFENIGILYWKRYVDDTYVLLDSTIPIKDVCNTLSQFHPAVKFTYEEEHPIDHTLPFLDVLVQRQPNAGFRTKIYRKPTFTGLMTKWTSFVPKMYKYNAISTMVYRAIKICSSFVAIHKEFKTIKKLATKNGYPISMVNSIINRQLNLFYNPPVRQTTPTLETDTIVLKIPYFARASEVYSKQIISATRKHYPQKKIRIVYDVNDRIASRFNPKDKIPDPIQAGVVYQATCPQCNDHYIGKTFRHLKTRVHEHLHSQKKDLCLKKQRENRTNDRRSDKERKGPTTRSQTGKLPPPRLPIDSPDIDELIEAPFVSK